MPYYSYKKPFSFKTSNDLEKLLDEEWIKAKCVSVNVSKVFSLSISKYLHEIICDLF